MEDGISGRLQHRHKMCCEKGGHRGRQACMVWKWFYCRDVVSGQVDLHMTTESFTHLCSYWTLCLVVATILHISDTHCIEFLHSVHI